MKVNFSFFLSEKGESFIRFFNHNCFIFLILTKRLLLLRKLKQERWSFLCYWKMQLRNTSIIVKKKDLWKKR